jgi:hypothetical protein
MRKFASLSPKNLSKDFDAEIQGEEPIVKLEETSGKITISYIFPGFYLVEDNRDIENKKLGFKQISIAAIGSMGESGRPQLPSFGRYVQIPQNVDFKISVKKDNPVVFEDVIVSPSQQMQIDSPTENAAFEYDSEFYSQDILYPEDIVSISGPFNIDQYNALLVHVTPFQYNPAAKKLTGYGNVTVTIKITRRKKAKAGDETKPSFAAFDRGASGNLLLNPGSRIDARLNLPEITSILPTSITTITPGALPLIRQRPVFLIIYAKAFEAAAKKLARWKTRRGLLTALVPIDSIGNSVSKIKSYIRNEKTKNPDLNYVLLFGDIDTIASETVPASVFLEYKTNNITDYYYSTKTDPTGSTSLIFPWLSIGRIPVAKDVDAMSIVDQIISYETMPSTDPKYYMRMVFAAYFQDDVPMDGKDDRGFLKTMEDLRSSLLPLGYNIKRVYVTNNTNMKYYYDGTPIPAEVKAAVVDSATATKMLIDAANEGQLFIGHRDHGGPDGWSHPPFTVNSLNSVTGKTTSIFYSINCLTGQFDINPTESFAEKNLRMDGTAPSLVAATRVSHSWLNNDLEKGLFDATFGGVIPTFPSGTASYPITFNRLGDVLNYAKSYLPIGASGSPQYIKDHFEIYHVIGDPTVELWTTAPRLVSVKAGIKTLLKRKVLDIIISECPKGCTLTIWADEQMVRRLEPSSTHVAISIDDLNLPAGTAKTKAIYVCFHAPGCGYKEVVVKIAI